MKGVLVWGVTPGSGAAAAGLRGMRKTEWGDTFVGDEIVAVDGQPVASTEDIRTVLERSEVGRAARVTVRREGKTFDVSVELKALPE